MQPTSLEAFESVRPSLSIMHQAVLQCIRNSGENGLTCDQVEAISAGRHQNISARINELAQVGAIVDSGKRRPTRSGRNAIVWIVGDWTPLPKSTDRQELNNLERQCCELLDLWVICERDASVESWQKLRNAMTRLEDVVGYSDYRAGRND